MEYEILKPFGPTIYKSKLSNDFMKFISEISEQTRTANINVGETLAGNISNQLEAVMDESQRKTFATEMFTHIYNAVYETEKKYCPDDENFINKEKLYFDFGNGPWINFQNSGEFNPMHSHTGKLSCVLYISVPECISEENNSGLKTNTPCAGQISWVYGSRDYGTDFSYLHQPKTGELFLFPAGLPHMVYPFKSDVERISLSFNVYNLRY